MPKNADLPARDVADLGRHELLPEAVRPLCNLVQDTCAARLPVFENTQDRCMLLRHFTSGSALLLLETVRPFCKFICSTHAAQLKSEGNGMQLIAQPAITFCAHVCLDDTFAHLIKVSNM